MKTALGRLILTFMFSGLLFGTSVALAEKKDNHGTPMDIITQPASKQSNVAIYVIENPDVAHSTTDYPTIQFRPGDYVLIQAGGCVQTGGHGKTWKRYVDPQGPNSDRFYSGFVLGQRLKDFGLNREHQIPGMGHLQLGYSDDGYGDNGYWGRAYDDGTGDQCKGLPNAYVIVAIRRGGGSPIDLTKLAEVTKYVNQNGVWTPPTTTTTHNANGCSAGTYHNGFSYVGWPGCATRTKDQHPSAFIMCDGSGFYCCENANGANDPKCGRGRRSFPPDCGNFGNAYLLQPGGCYRKN